MPKKKSSGATTGPTIEHKPAARSGNAAAPGLTRVNDATCKELDSNQHPQGATGQLLPKTGDDDIQNLEFSNEDEFAFEEVRLELFRRKELALLELKKLVAESSKKRNPSESQS